MSDCQRSALKNKVLINFYLATDAHICGIMQFHAVIACSYLFFFFKSLSLCGALAGA